MHSLYRRQRQRCNRVHERFGLCSLCGWAFRRRRFRRMPRLPAWYLRRNRIGRELHKLRGWNFKSRIRLHESDSMCLLQRRNFRRYGRLFCMRQLHRWNVLLIDRLLCLR